MKIDQNASAESIFYVLTLRIFFIITKICSLALSFAAYLDPWSQTLLLICYNITFR